ncbi:hypothetical protein N7495_001949 [Penicillium taxi]|uniref:uncharacterized protein n=1 Tax=Penicillium taxi TaxID=168475 RepID=UPI0025455128|nr:uncharacterized protein N7495_001949 [Penicillium taxi]KAJ5909267.1 hypothetical protein N7495_001949 [Penicillium taxi]
MVFVRISTTLVAALMLQAQYANTLYINTSDSLAGISASKACVDAMATNVSCYTGLSQVVINTMAWSASTLSDICTTDFSSFLSSYVSSMNKACGASTKYNISGTSQTAADRGREI